jgi:hypothetical protein
LIVVSIFVETVELFAGWADEGVLIVVRHSRVCVAEPTVYLDGESFSAGEDQEKLLELLL